MLVVCATNLWAVNAAAWGPDLDAWTTSTLGTPPQRSELRIGSSRVRGSSVVFTLTRNMCDCDALVGLRDRVADPQEIAPEAWLAWLHEMPEHVPHVARVAVLHTWSPQDDVVTPHHARGVHIGQVDEALLRGVPDDGLVTIDYPRAG